MEMSSLTTYLLMISGSPKSQILGDFGLSKLLKVDNYVTTMVIGCMSYIDPVFMKTGHLTQKSDVYS